MGIITWIVLGALAGWIASMIVGKNSEMGAFANVCIGIAGAFIGGFVFNLITADGWALFHALERAGLTERSRIDYTNKIFNMDCVSGMGMSPDKSIDLILCDLPYGITGCR